ncbi:IS1595 family transposase [Halosimplex halobium]|uniref:IS1595 family transposase n=1 Tax=Halosimplex halobium TaxID=3396618 RepID=UPI003F576A56
MFPLQTFVSERRAANLLAQIRWRDGVYCPRCRAESVIRYGSYREFQRYLCKDCGRTFNDKTGTVFEYSAIPLRKWYLAVYTYIRLNVSIRQLDAELAVTYKTVYRRVQRFLRALDAPRPRLDGPVEIDELYVSAGKKGRERDRPSRSRGLSTRGRGTYNEDKPPVFVLVDRGSGEEYVHPAKAAEESTIRLLLGDRQQESLTVYTDGFRAYEPLDEDDAFDRKYVVHGEGEYADGDVHVNTCESHASLARRWLSPHRGVSKDNLTPYLRALQLRKQVRRKPGDEALKTILETAL